MKKYIYKIPGFIIFLGMLISCRGQDKPNTPKDSLTNKTPPINQKAIVTASSGLTLRVSPKAYYDSAYLIPYNAIVEVLEQTEQIETHRGIMGKWYKITHKERQGYVFGGYLESGTQLSMPKLYPKVEKIFDTELKGVKQRALVNSQTGLVLRKKPSTAAESLAMLEHKEEVGVLEVLTTSETVESRWGSWCKVRFRQDEGYLFSGFLVFSKALVKSENGTKMRQKPSIDSPMELYIPKGRVVFIANDAPVHQGFIGKTLGVWYKVIYQRKEGYIFSPDLAINGY